MTKAKDHEPFLFMISSVIYFKNKSLGYSSVRSIFTAKEREVQTLKTIQSIRSKVPDAFIVLIESGLSKQVDATIINLVDQFIYTGNNKIVRWACDSKRKGLGEAVSLYFGSKKIILKKHKYCFKISGRYYLNDDFTLSTFDNEKDLTLKIYTDPLQMSTRLYGFQNVFFSTWRKSLFGLFLGLYRNRSIEELLYARLRKYQIKEIKTLGVSGLVGPDGNAINE